MAFEAACPRFRSLTRRWPKAHRTGLRTVRVGDRTATARKPSVTYGPPGQILARRVGSCRLDPGYEPEPGDPATDQQVIEDVVPRLVDVGTAATASCLIVTFISSQA
jgi:hypothetical protein